MSRVGNRLRLAQPETQQLGSPNPCQRCDAPSLLVSMAVAFSWSPTMLLPPYSSTSRPPTGLVVVPSLHWAWRGEGRRGERGRMGLSAAWWQANEVGYVCEKNRLIKAAAYQATKLSGPPSSKCHPDRRACQ